MKKIVEAFKGNKRIRTLRRISQVFFFSLFVFLLFRTDFSGTFDAEATEPIVLDYPVSIFLEMDPLVAFSTAISTQTLYKNVIWALVIIAGTLVLGRFFCGWICPLGSLSHFLSSYKPERKGKKRLQANRYKRWMTTKFYLLIGVIVMSIFTSLWTGIIDPIPFLVRSLTVSILPTLNLIVRGTLDALYATDLTPLQAVADSGYRLFSTNLLTYEPRYYHWGALIGLIFMGVMLLNRFITRFWCRGICPLGALMGLLSRFSIYGMEKDHAACDDCNVCILHCQGACEPQGGVKWRQAECHLCFNCEAGCPNDVIHFKFFPKPDAMKVEADLRRRKVLTATAAGIVALPILRSTTGLAKDFDPRVIRPPGSVEEEEFLARCIRCGECMKVCPNNAIHPTLFESGIEGIWTPILIMRVGYCESTCTLCSQVCPTGAIWEMTEDERMGKVDAGKDPNTKGFPAQEGKPVKIGTAFYDRGRCLPWAMDIPCIVCEEFCPTSPKAIWVMEEQVTRSDGTAITVQRPRVDVDLCIGCGVCENVCPVQNEPAVYVTNIGETRSRTNQIRLGTSYAE
jgi:polyferredoxin